MKHLLLFLSLSMLLIASARGQPFGDKNTNVQMRGGLTIDSLMLPPLYADTPTSSRIRVNLSIVRVVKSGDTSLYVFVNNSWRRIVASTSGSNTLQQVLNAGNSATNQKILLTNNNVLDSLILSIKGYGSKMRSLTVQNLTDTAGTGLLNRTEINALNYQGKGVHMFAFSPGTTTPYAVLQGDMDSALIIQTNNGQHIIFEHSVFHGYDAYGFFAGGSTYGLPIVPDKSLNLTNDQYSHLGWSNHSNGLFVGGNTVLNQTITCNDSSRGVAVFKAGNYNDAGYLQPVGFNFLSIPSTGTYFDAFKILGDGESFLQKNLTVGDISHSTGNRGTLNVLNPNNATSPLIFLDRGNASGDSFMVLQRYLNIPEGFIGAFGEMGMQKYFAITPTKTAAATVIDSIARYNTTTKEFEVAKFFAYGSSTQSGNGSTTVFNIAHGLGVTPTTWQVTPASLAAVGSYYVTADATNLIITYTLPPTSGTNNLIFKYTAK